MDGTLSGVLMRQGGALAIAGLLAIPIVLTEGGRQPVVARVSAPTAKVAPSVEGKARAIDGDTIAIGEVRVRLEGIDAPEHDQTCKRASTSRWGFRIRSSETWNCGREATEHVARLVRDRSVRCESRGTDAYGRTLGICVVAGLEINADLVRQGLAWAFVKYSQRYVSLEAEARAAKRGIWNGEATPPWAFRAERWQAAAADKSTPEKTNCLIKGNISRGQQIYHMPWERWYEKTRIETGKGERWFCSEGEAVAAGWRPAAAN